MRAAEAKEHTARTLEACATKVARLTQAEKERDNVANLRNQLLALSQQVANGAPRADILV